MASSAPVTLCTDPDEAEHDESSMSQANTDSQCSGSNGSVHLSYTQLSNSSSNSSAICRICQLTEGESGVKLENTGCSCKGSMMKCHPACLQEWVRTKRSSLCELCRQRFPNIPEHVIRPRLTLNVSTAEVAGNEEVDIEDVGGSPLPQATISHRVYLGAVQILLLFLSAFAGYLTSITRAGYEEARTNVAAWGLKNLEDARFIYGLCLGILIFCGTVFSGLSIFWICLEMSLYARECFLLYERPRAMALRSAGFSTAPSRPVVQI